RSRGDRAARRRGGRAPAELRAGRAGARPAALSDDAGSPAGGAGPLERVPPLEAAAGVRGTPRAAGEPARCPRRGAAVRAGLAVVGLAPDRAGRAGDRATPRP